MYNIILTSLLPIFLIIALGTVLRGSNFLPADFFPNLNRLAFYVGLPVFLFSRIASSPIEGGPALRIFWVVLVGSTVAAAAACLVAWKSRLNGPGRGAFIQAALRGNLAYIGLPVIFYSLAGTGALDSGTETTAMLVLAPTVPIYNIFSIIILIRFGQQGRASPRLLSLAGKVLRNPLLIACLLGLLVSWSGITLPTLLVRTMEPLSQIALPLALLAIGAALAHGGLGRKLGATMTASVLKVGLAPLAGFWVAGLFGLSPIEMRIALIFLACPTAVTGYVMAELLGADAELAGNAVVVSTLFSFFSLAAVLILV